MVYIDPYSKHNHVQALSDRVFLVGVKLFSLRMFFLVLQHNYCLDKMMQVKKVNKQTLKSRAQERRKTKCPASRQVEEEYLQRCSNNGNNASLFLVPVNRDVGLSNQIDFFKKI